MTRSEAQALNNAATMVDSNAVAPMVGNEGPGGYHWLTALRTLLGF
jgi:hypothetical protein